MLSLFANNAKKFYSRISEKKIYIATFIICIFALIYANYQYKKIKDKFIYEIIFTPEVLAIYILNSDDLDKFSNPLRINLSSFWDETNNITDITPVGKINSSKNRFVTISILNSADNSKIFDRNLDNFYRVEPLDSTIFYYHKINQNEYLSIEIVDDQSFSFLRELKNENKQNIFLIALYFLGIFIVFLYFEAQKKRH